MQILSAADAVSPAIVRTKQILFAPFRPGRSWKLSATGYLAFASTVFLPFPLFYVSFATTMLRQGHTSLATLALIAILVAFVVFAWFFYLFSRLQFCFFDIVLDRGQFVAPAWRKYGPQTWPWMGAKIVFGTAFMLVTVLPFVPVILRTLGNFAGLQRQMMTPGQPPPPQFVGQLIGFELLVFGVFGFLFIFDSMLTDFVLPSLALESVPLLEAFRRFGRLVKNEPGQMLLYIVLKTGMTVVGYILMVVAYFAVILIYLLVFAVLCLIGYVVLHALGVSSAVMLIVAACVGFPTYVVVLFYVSILSSGAVLTFLQAYALYFLGGRYPLLGERLAASEPRPSAPPVPPLAFSEPPPNPYAYLNLPPGPPAV